MNLSDEHDAIVAAISRLKLRPEPFYTDDLVTLYHGDCFEVLPTLELGSVDVLLTDPPYFQVKDEEWDRQWRRVEQFLAWLGGVLDLCKPLLAPSASVWVFASSELCDEVKQVVKARFRVLNSIRWVKDAGWHRKAEVEAQRRYATPWEAVVFAEQFHDAYEEQSLALHRQVFAPIGRYIAQERKQAGLTRDQVDVSLGFVRTANPTRGTELCRRWEEGSSLPTAEAYGKLRALLGDGHLARDYEDLRRQYEDLRRPFRLSDRGPVTDLWTFPPVMGYPGKHPCEKPASMLRHMLTTSTRGPGAVVLDPFAGSCSTLRVCKELGLAGIGIESEQRYCAHAEPRLSQDVLPFGEDHGQACRS